MASIFGYDTSDEPESGLGGYVLRNATSTLGDLATNVPASVLLHHYRNQIDSALNNGVDMSRHPRLQSAYRRLRGYGSKISTRFAGLNLPTWRLNSRLSSLKAVKKAGPWVKKAAHYVNPANLAPAVSKGLDKASTKVVWPVADSLLPHVTKAGRGHAVAKVATSRLGLAAGFAIGGATDGIRGLINSDLGSAFDGDELASKYHSYSQTAFRALGRTLWGTARAVDSTLFGTLGMVPVLGERLNSDDYVNPELDRAGDDKFLSDLAEAKTPAEAVELARNRDKTDLEQLAKGRDANGNVLYTTGADGKVHEMTSDEGAQMVNAILDNRKRAAQERELMMRNSSGTSTVDARSLSHALDRIDAKFNEDLDRLNTRFDTFDDWSLTPEGARILRGKSRDQWAKVAAETLEKQWSTRRQSLMNTDVYKNHIDNNRTVALQTYKDLIGPQNINDNTDHVFGAFWDAQDDRYRETFDPTSFTAQFMSLMRDGQ